MLTPSFQGVYIVPTTSTKSLYFHVIKTDYQGNVKQSALFPFQNIITPWLRKQVMHECVDFVFPSILSHAYDVMGCSAFKNAYERHFLKPCDNVDFTVTGIHVKDHTDFMTMFSFCSMLINMPDFGDTIPHYIPKSML